MDYFSYRFVFQLNNIVDLQVSFQNKYYTWSKVTEQLLKTKAHTHKQGGDTCKQYGNFNTWSFQE